MRYTKEQIFIQFRSLFLVIVGTFIISFGAIVFLEPLNIISGGVTGIAIIFEQLSSDPDTKLMIYNIVSGGLTIGFFFLGVFTIGKEFAFKTLVGTVTLPIANAVFSYVPGINDLVRSMIEAITVDSSIGTSMLCGIFGGVAVGAGVGLTFMSGGSSGGVDVLSFLLYKFLKIKQSIGSFLVDGTIIVIGLFILPMSHFPLGLVGILSAFITALLIDFIYIGSQTSYQVDIISNEWEKISNFAQDELGRGATIIPAKGGYKGEDRVILRVVFDRSQYSKIRDYIAQVDPHAFITFTSTNAVYGEGFKVNKKEKLIEKKSNGK